IRSSLSAGAGVRGVGHSLRRRHARQSGQLQRYSRRQPLEQSRGLSRAVHPARQQSSGIFQHHRPPSLDDTGNLNAPYFGAGDEGAKINVNAVMKLDSTGQKLHDILVKLPNMTEDIANNIVAWMGGQVGIQNGGATNDTYM